MAQYSVRDARTDLCRLIDDVLAGGEVVIARRGIPLVRLIPVVLHGRRCFGAYKGEISMDERFFEPLSGDEQETWSLT